MTLLCTLLCLSNSAFGRQAASAVTAETGSSTELVAILLPTLAVAHFSNHSCKGRPGTATCPKTESQHPQNMQIGADRKQTRSDHLIPSLSLFIPASLSLGAALSGVLFGRACLN